MSDVLSQASLVMIPSGYKAGTVYSVKPTNGDGDLSFTRSNDTATRVNSAGLIEKVRTNLLTYSEEFDDASWTKTNSTITANAAVSPDGYINADELFFTASGGFHLIDQSVSLTSGTTYTQSYFVKDNGQNFVQIYTAGVMGTTDYVNFNLTNGSISDSLGITGEIVNYGNGWYRISATKTASSTGNGLLPISGIPTATSGRRPSYTGSGESIYLYGAQLETGDIATDYIPTTSAAVSVGMTANVPRLDYSGGGCPKLLLEGQRTNFFTYSEQFDNSDWTKNNCTITANDTTAPDGYTSADRITVTSSGQSFAQSPTLTSGQPFVFSVFVKEGNWGIIRIGNSTSATSGAWFNVTNGTAGTINGGTSEIIDYGNGWYRLIAKFTSFTTGTCFIALSNSDGSTTTSAIDTFMYVWGAQIEEGSYATSYIPTLSAASTRGADDVPQKDITSFGIGNSYTLFWDLSLNSSVFNAVFWELYNSSSTTTFTIRNFNGVLRAYNNIDLSYPLFVTASSNNKYIIRIDETSYSIFYSNSGTPTKSTATMTTARDLGYISFRGDLTDWTLNQHLIFPTALTDTQCLELIS